MTESLTDKVLLQLRTDYEAYSHNQNNVIKAAEAKEAIEVIESLQKDADRYEWLASQVLYCDFGDNKVRELGWRITERFASRPLMFGASINAAIDQALSQQVEANHK